MCRGVSSALEDNLSKAMTIEWAKVGALDKCFIRFIDAWVMKELQGMEKRLDPSRFFHTEATGRS